MRIIQGNIYDIQAELNLVRAADKRKKDNQAILEQAGKRVKKVRYEDNLYIHPAVARSKEFQAAMKLQHKLVEEGKDFDARLNISRIIDSLERAVAGEKVQLVKLKEKV